MKTLYESILDDEDILMGDIKKDANNPFLVLYNYYISNGEKIPFGKQKDISSILKPLELPLKSPLTAFEINIIDRKLFAIHGDDNIALCYITLDDEFSYNGISYDCKLFIEFLDHGDWGRKKMNYYMKSWTKKYNLEHASKNIYYLQ
jgi:hypothetical protein